VEALALVPRPAGVQLLGALGWLAFHAMPGQRALVQRQIDLVYQDRHPAWRRRLCRSVFVALGRSAADFARLRRPDRRTLRAVVPVAGEWTHLDRAHAQGRGVVVVSAHYGSWELLPAILAARGYRVAAVVRPNREVRVDRLLCRLRSALGVRLVPRTADARVLVRALRGGAIVVIAGDQRPRGRRMDGRFLGLRAWLPLGPASLAVLSGVPLVTALVRRGLCGRQEIVLGEPMQAPADLDRRAAIGELARRSTDELEREIARDPSQWAWFHERWKSAPARGGDGDVCRRPGHAAGRRMRA
jgi:KDO2-lipid IV(A) lauroyltransferase